MTALVETHRAAIQTLVFRYLADNRHLEPTVNDIMNQMTAAVREAQEIEWDRCSQRIDMLRNAVAATHSHISTEATCPLCATFADAERAIAARTEGQDA